MRVFRIPFIFTLDNLFGTILNVSIRSLIVKIKSVRKLSFQFRNVHNLVLNIGLRVIASNELRHENDTNYNAVSLTHEQQ